MELWCLTLFATALVNVRVRRIQRASAGRLRRRNSRHRHLIQGRDQHEELVRGRRATTAAENETLSSGRAETQGCLTEGAAQVPTLLVLDYCKNVILVHEDMLRICDGNVVNTTKIIPP